MCIKTNVILYIKPELFFILLSKIKIFISINNSGLIYFLCFSIKVITSYILKSHLCSTDNFYSNIPSATYIYVQLMNVLFQMQ